ncbi:MAG: hypothetical protein HY864_07295 [Chloroflexi bacterium]|nr:hypothetical protein [Chloroflexota bacterium]
MTLPTLIFALIVSTLCGVLYNFLRGGTGWRLLLYSGLSALGFALGQWIGVWRGWALFTFGALDIGLGVLGGFLLLLFGDWLSRIEAKK